MRVHLHNGRAAVEFPANEKFQGPVTIAAFVLGLPTTGTYGDTAAEGERTVLFPHDTSLQLDVHMFESRLSAGRRSARQIFMSTRHRVTRQRERWDSSSWTKPWRSASEPMRIFGRIPASMPSAPIRQVKAKCQESSAPIWTNSISQSLSPKDSNSSPKSCCRGKG